MNDTSPRCAASGTTCRLLQLETPGARPVWAVLDAAGARRFTGEITLASRPQVRAWFHDGAVYYAERAGDPSIGDRLIEYGVLTPEQLAAGTVQLGAIAHLGRLFDRVPSIERDPVELVLEVVTGEVLGRDRRPHRRRDLDRQLSPSPERCVEVAARRRNRPMTHRRPARCR